MNIRCEVQCRKYRETDQVESELLRKCYCSKEVGKQPTKALQKCLSLSAPT